MNDNLAFIVEHIWNRHSAPLQKLHGTDVCLAIESTIAWSTQQILLPVNNHTDSSTLAPKPPWNNFVGYRSKTILAMSSQRTNTHHLQSSERLHGRELPSATLLRRLAPGGKVFCVIDLRKAFYQIPITEEDIFEFSRSLMCCCPITPIQHRPSHTWPPANQMLHRRYFRDFRRPHTTPSSTKV